MQDLKVSLIQADQCWEDATANLEKFESFISQLADSDLIVLPEMFHTSFSMNSSLAEEWLDNPIIEQLKHWAANHQFAIYTSMMVRENQQYFNRGVFVEPSGKVSQYNKRRSFGLGGEDKIFTEGTTETIVEFKGWKFNLQICYDLRFPELIRNRIQSNGQSAYDVLLYVANWPEKRVFHWSTLLKARAIENQCYTIGVNRVGVDGNDIVYSGASAVYSGLGATVLEMDSQEAVQTCTLLWADIQQLRFQLPFLKDRK